jgi:hypothetical protein
MGRMSVKKKIVDIATYRWGRHCWKIFVGGSLPEEDAIIFCGMQIFENVLDAMIVKGMWCATIL